MNLSEKLQKVDRLKAWLDSFRPLSPTLVAELKKLYDVRFTYHSNAIEGNSLTQRETELVLETGITVGGKTLREHLEVIGHRDAIDYIEMLTRSDSAIGEWEIQQIHNLIIRAIARGSWTLPAVRCQSRRYRIPQSASLFTQQFDAGIYRMAQQR